MKFQLFIHTKNQKISFKWVLSYNDNYLPNSSLHVVIYTTALSINTCGNACMILMFVKCVLELTVIQNLHFFYQCRFRQTEKNIVAAFRGMHVLPAKHRYAWQPRKCDWRTERHKDRQTDTRQNDPYEPLCFIGDTKQQLFQERPSYWYVDKQANYKYISAKYAKYSRNMYVAFESFDSIVWLPKCLTSVQTDNHRTKQSLQVTLLSASNILIIPSINNNQLWLKLNITVPWLSVWRNT